MRRFSWIKVRFNAVKNFHDINYDFVNLQCCKVL